MDAEKLRQEFRDELWAANHSDEGTFYYLLRWLQCLIARREEERDGKG